MKYTFEDIHELFLDYNEAIWSPSRMDVHIDCGCGCGGDSYTLEQWNKEEQAAEEAIANMKAFCAVFGIEYTGVE